MSLATPTTVTINAVPYALSKINQDAFGSTYFYKVAGANGPEFKMIVRHSYEGKAGSPQIERHNVEFINTTFLVDGTPVVRNAFFTMRKPRSEDVTAINNTSAGFLTWLSANIANLQAWES